MIIVGHRGARGEYPENTLQGFEYTQALGIRQLEYDLRLSRDLAVFTLHDESLARTCGIDTVASTQTLSQLQALSANADFIASPAATIASLEQVFEHCSDIELSQLEVKTDYPDLIDRLVPEIIAIVQKFQQQQRVVITSFDQYVLRVARRIDANITRGFLCEQADIDAVATAIELGCNWVIWDYPLLDSVEITRAKQQGLQVSVFTVNEVADMDKCLHLGIDSMITDFPSRALQHFNKEN
ncbi:Glycerophosphodiester phosphodiesterase, cytoplasmic [Sinobacterium norvegicum]|uniref:Glycerophosphodiester phosphodiesterase, cytoplasmic n=1 Tax=Sinobacterium norvegicum TaxID=1641715 RepID=A0ABM9ABM9_9GAMM|nr:glycerophosphodiester phosphodiesterase [Sinobacterium norvegicum]CAH0989995.1 Glycerophosphodiester phosphodiesterase, cytoplasmic [Sinobacterium norvegicum]